jgi:hypothetical protein
MPAIFLRGQFRYVPLARIYPKPRSRDELVIGDLAAFLVNVSASRAAISYCKNFVKQKICVPFLRARVLLRECAVCGQPFP